MRRLRVGAVHATRDDALPLALELGELSLVRGELGAELEAFGLFLRDEVEEVGVPVKSALGVCAECGGWPAGTYFSVKVRGGRSACAPSRTFVAGRLRRSRFSEGLSDGLWLREVLRLREEPEEGVVGDRRSHVGEWLLG